MMNPTPWLELWPNYVVNHLDQEVFVEAHRTGDLNQLLLGP